MKNTKSMTNEEKDKWEQVRINASISILNSLLEQTEHAIIEETVIKNAYARVAISYADELIRELNRDKDWLQKIIEI